MPFSNKPWSQFSNIDSLITNTIAQVGKDNTVNSIVKDLKGGKKIDLEKVIWAMQNAHTQDLPDLIKRFRG